ncbi:MAG: mevalonate kinase [Thaumarchaeota archaeon]|nr:mevalonate kinase [Nitrososphaerota archaeon]
MKKFVAASAPGKVILTGEHFVVHGSYAVAAAINKRVKVSVSPSEDGESWINSRGIRSRVDSIDEEFPAARTIARRIIQEFGEKTDAFEMLIESEIPAGSGLGSSSAVSVACTAALSKYFGAKLDDKEIFELSMEGERKVHGNPSGIDVQASLMGGIILFSRKTGAKSISLGKSIEIIVIFSGKKRSTSRLVAAVARRKERYPHFFQQLTDSASFQSLELVDALKVADFSRLGALFNIAQAELDWIGVSTDYIDELIERVSGLETLGAKITGAGGGGSIIAIPKPEASRSLLESALEHHEYSFITSFPQEGLRWEK